jgi:hypothetical protein
MNFTTGPALHEVLRRRLGLLRSARDVYNSI